MKQPTIYNYVLYEKRDPPGEDGGMRYYSLSGIKDFSKPNFIYLWRNYNTFDEESTPIPNDFTRVHNGYIDCDECNSLNEQCPRHLESRKKYMHDYRFGTKVFAEDYHPKVINHSGEVCLVHDNGGRPFKVYIDHDNKEIHVYTLNRNIIFTSKFYRKEYSHSNAVIMSAGTEYQLAMNPTCSSESSESEEMSSESSESEESKVDYYDQHIGSYSYEKVWIPDGYYLTRNSESDVVQDKSGRYYGNSILAHLGQTNTKENKYLLIGESVVEFSTDDEIQRYYSTVGNSDVPYPVAIGNKYIFFSIGVPYVEPLEKYANLSEEQLSDAYTYHYGHSCFICHAYECNCDKPEYPSIEISSKIICKRDF
jgi:hypothetical protein